MIRAMVEKDGMIREMRFDGWNELSQKLQLEAQKTDDSTETPSEQPRPMLKRKSRAMTEEPDK